MYLQAFPESSGRHLVSTNGGTDPVWSRDGAELFYSQGGQVWTVSVDQQPTLSLGTPTPLFEWRNGLALRFDVFDDGEFVMVRTNPDSGPHQFQVVLNRVEELKRLAPID